MNVNDPKLFNRLHSLAVRQLESTLSDAEFDELQVLLADSSAARRLYVQYHQETACLRWLCLENVAAQMVMPSEPRPSLTTHSPRPHRWVMAAITAAIACSILFVAVTSLMPSRSIFRDNATFDQTFERTEELSALGQQVATVTALDAARWEGKSNAQPLLSRCMIGQRWQLTSGRAELTFDAGALVTIFAPADFDIISPTSIRCRRGRVTALVDERGKGFTVETPQATVIDLGTQFGLDISEDGATQVVVFQGSVDLSPADGSEVRRMERGDGLLLTNSGEMERLVSVRRDSYLADGLRNGNGAPLIADVRDNIRENGSSKSYQIVHGGFSEDALSFVDRDHEWNGIEKEGLPEVLIDADYIMPFNDDKFIRELELNVELTRPAMLYVFLDNNMEVPDWVRREFEDTGFDIGLDGATTEWHPDNSLGIGSGESVDFTFSVWQRAITQPGSVQLGGLTPPKKKRSLGFNMYGIAAVELERVAKFAVPKP